MFGQGELKITLLNASEDSAANLSPSVEDKTRLSKPVVEDKQSRTIVDLANEDRLPQ
jgi:hypothetical protein